MAAVSRRNGVRRHVPPVLALQVVMALGVLGSLADDVKLTLVDFSHFLNPKQYDITSLATVPTHMTTFYLDCTSDNPQTAASLAWSKVGETTPLDAYVQSLPNDGKRLDLDALKDSGMCIYGTYVCGSRTVEVTEANPAIKEDNFITEAQSGDSVELSAVFSGFPFPTASNISCAKLTAGGSSTSLVPQVSSGMIVLYIENATVDDSGPYRCSVSVTSSVTCASTENSVVMELTVSPAPMPPAYGNNTSGVLIDEGPQNTTGQERGTVNLTCSASPSPSSPSHGSHISWRREGGAPLPMGSYSLTKAHPEGNSATSTLVFPNLQLEDADLYYCEVTLVSYETGTATFDTSHPARIQVLRVLRLFEVRKQQGEEEERREITDAAPSITLASGANLKVQCVGSRSGGGGGGGEGEEEVLRWKGNGTDVPTGGGSGTERVYQESESDAVDSVQSLNFLSPTQEDAGLYTCYSTTDDTLTALLNVFIEPDDGGDPCSLDGGGRPGGCEHTCSAVEGAPVCGCNAGYQVQPNDPKSCQDIDECATNNGGCKQTCTNTEGNYTCECWSGYTQDGPDGCSCIDVDECQVMNGGCEHICNNTNGSFFCSCRSGYELSGNNTSCSLQTCRVSESNSKTVVISLSVALGVLPIFFVIVIVILLVLLCICRKRCSVAPTRDVHCVYKNNLSTGSGEESITKSTTEMINC